MKVWPGSTGPTRALLADVFDLDHPRTTSHGTRSWVSLARCDMSDSTKTHGNPFTSPTNKFRCAECPSRFVRRVIPKVWEMPSEKKCWQSTKINRLRT